MVIKQTIFLVVYLISVKSNSEERMNTLNFKEFIEFVKENILEPDKLTIGVNWAKNHLSQATNDSKPSCLNCRHWNSNGITHYGECTNKEVQDRLLLKGEKFKHDFSCKYAELFY